MLQIMRYGCSPHSRQVVCTTNGLALSASGGKRSASISSCAKIIPGFRPDRFWSGLSMLRWILADFDGTAVFKDVTWVEHHLITVLQSAQDFSVAVVQMFDLDRLDMSNSVDYLEHRPIPV